jgi:hypothetical protein
MFQVPEERVGKATAIFSLFLQFMLRYWGLSFFCLYLLLCSIPHSVQAQLRQDKTKDTKLVAQRQGLFDNWRDRISWHSGFMLEFFNLEQPSGQAAFQTAPSMYGINLGATYVLTQSADWLSVVADAGLQGAFSYSNLFGGSYMIQAPIFIMGKIGAGTTKFNQMPLGAGVGLGINPTYVRMPYITPSGNLGALKPAFLGPCVVGDLTLGFLSSKLTIRVHYMPFNEQITLTDIVQGQRFTYPMNLRNFGGGLIYYF